MDRDPATQPNLSDMTTKAIEILSQNPKGFFLFVEGSKVDWAAHSNDPIGVISDTNAFDQAMGVALDFAKRDGHTLVIATADHGNGGISIGNASTSHGYDTTSYATIPDPLKRATRTGQARPGSCCRGTTPTDSGWSLACAWMSQARPVPANGPWPGAGSAGIAPCGSAGHVKKDWGLADFRLVLTRSSPEGRRNLHVIKNYS